jgi:hypothetical protein
MDLFEAAADIARELREHPRHWTQKVFARDVLGNPVFWSDPDAVCWCLAGHLCRRAPLHQRSQLLYVLMSVPRDLMLGHQSVSQFNDAKGRTVEQVIALCEALAAKRPK